MALSSSSLIHLTKQKDSLKGILSTGFKTKFCLEKITGQSDLVQAAFPMVSFCDIPLSEIKNHIVSYGRYGLGLTKEWGKANGLNPVLYLEKTSTLSRKIWIAQSKVIQSIESNTERNNDLMHTLLDIFAYTKNYENELIRHEEQHDNYRFSDEREWRFVPEIDILSQKNLLPIIPKQDYETRRLELNNAVGEIVLDFTPNDIKYVIIDNEGEINEFVQFLSEIKGSKYSYHDVQRLTTRIITSDQIENDL